MVLILEILGFCDCVKLSQAQADSYSIFISKNFVRKAKNIEKLFVYNLLALPDQGRRFGKEASFVLKLKV